jgi:hypothetical protein
MSAESDAGVAARAANQAYYTISEEDRDRYHNKANCPDGKRIEYQHIRAGYGTGRTPCKECPKV